MDDVGTMRERKREQLEICAKPELYPVETAARAARFGEVHLVHRALPELAADEVDPGVDFLGTRCALPLFISCMTGGTGEASTVNRELARAAQRAGIAVGSGSFRLLLRHEELAGQFNLKTWAPDVPHIANISAVQLREAGAEVVLELARRIGADALALHLNAGQELFQGAGDRDFRGLYDAIGTLVNRAAIPVIVKETGFGLAPFELRRLLDLGVAYVDVAGAGGTNWIAVEAERLEDGPERRAAAEFAEWGYPTALLLAASGDTAGRLLASGGIRTGLDVLKAIALGAALAGMALPFARLALERGAEGVLEKLAELDMVIRRAMLLVGARRTADLDRNKLWFESGFAADAALLASCGASGGASAGGSGGH